MRGRRKFIVTTWSGSRVDTGESSILHFKVLAGWLRYISHGHNWPHKFHRVQELLDSMRADYADNHPELPIPNDAGEMFHVTTAEGRIWAVGTLEELRNYLNDRFGEARACGVPGSERQPRPRRDPPERTPGVV